MRWFEYQYWMSDPAALFLVMLAFFLVERGKWGPRRHERRRGVRARDLHPRLPVRLPARAAPGPPLLACGTGDAALAALPFAILVAIRRLVTPEPARRLRFRNRRQHDLPPQPPARQPALRRDARRRSACSCRSCCCSPARLLAVARRHFDRALYVLSVYATLVISNNNERPLAYALPALVPAALWCLRAFLEETRLPALPVLRRGSGPSGPVLDWPALGRDRHEHLPAGQLDDGRGDGRLRLAAQALRARRRLS